MCGMGGSLSQIDPKRFLQDELSRRCSENPRYSLRAFAGFLDLSPSNLCMLLSGTRRFSRNVSKKIVNRLELEPVVRDAFLRGCLLNRAHTEDGSLFSSEVSQQDYRTLELEHYRMISDWHHYAILSLIDTDDFRPNAAWMARRLGISVSEVKSAVSRLRQLGILETRGKRWRQLTPPLKVDNKSMVPFIRETHRRILEKAIKSLETDPFDTRDFSSATMAIDPRHLPLAIREITRFRRYLMELLESKGSAKEVYHLSIQLYPVTKVRRKS